MIGRGSRGWHSNSTISLANVIYQLVGCLSFRCGVITIEHRFDFTFEFPLALVGDPSGRRNCAAHSRCCPFILNRILSDKPRSGSGLLSTTRRQPKRSQRSLATGNGPREGRKGRLLPRAMQHPQAAMCHEGVWQRFARKWAISPWREPLESLLRGQSRQTGRITILTCRVTPVLSV